ncbi:DUF2914 domain-containing protein [Kaarinaea lacus]
MNGSLGKKSSYAIFVVFLLIVWLIVANLEDVEVAEESQKLKESASETIKEGSQKLKERYIDNDENTSDKLKEDVLKLGELYFEGVETTADLVMEKSEEVGQQLIDEGKNIVQKVGDYVDPEEVVKVGFSNAINPETQVAANKINYLFAKSTVKSEILQKMDIELSCDLSTTLPTKNAKNIDADYLSNCNYALHRFNHSQRSCIASANNSLLLKRSELISGTIQSICENACQHKKALDSCIEEQDKYKEQEPNLTQQQADELARQAIKINNASAEYQCIDNDLVISELARLRQLVRQCNNDKDCDVESEAFKEHYADESQRILYFYDRGREDLFDTYEDDNFVEEHDTNSLFKTKHVSRALLTTGVKQREPVDNVCIPERNKITFFTEINNYANHRVTHRWKYNDKTLFELSFNVRGPRWRVWTSKNIPVKSVGPWVIEVVDEDGNILAQKLFYYSP